MTLVSQCQNLIYWIATFYFDHWCPLVCSVIHGDVFEIALNVGVEWPQGRNPPSVLLWNASQKKASPANCIKCAAANWPWRWRVPVWTLRLKTVFMPSCLLSTCLTSSQVSKTGNGVYLLVHSRWHLCSSPWGWKHLDTEPCEQLQSLLLISTQTRWVLLALAASLSVLQASSQSLLALIMFAVPICVEVLYLCTDSLPVGR